MTDMENVIKWLEYDYFPRIGAYRKDCKQGCDACMPNHDGDDYCDIDMLCNVLALLKEQEHKDRMYHALEDDWKRLKKLLKEQEAVVRCKDCVNRHDPINCKMYSEGMDTSDEWFCADGERKTE